MYLALQQVLLLTMDETGTMGLPKTNFYIVEAVICMLAWLVFACVVGRSIVLKVNCTRWMTGFVVSQVVSVLKELESNVLEFFIYEQNERLLWKIVPSFIEFVCVVILVVWQLNVGSKLEEADHSLYAHLEAAERVAPPVDKGSIWNQLLNFRAVIFGSADSPFLDLSVTSWMEVAIASKMMIQFAVKVKSVEVGTYKIWRTLNDFELLQQKLSSVANGADLPFLVISRDASLVQKRDILDKYLHDLSSCKSGDISKILVEFTDLEERIQSLNPVLKSKPASYTRDSQSFSDQQAILLDDDHEESKEKEDARKRKMRAEKMEREVFTRQNATSMSIASSPSKIFVLTERKANEKESSKGRISKKASTVASTLIPDDLDYDDDTSQYSTNVTKQSTASSRHSALINTIDSKVVSQQDQIILRNLRGCIMLSFIGHIRAIDTADKEVIFYSIAVRTKTGDWVVQKRFSQFSKLLEAMKKSLGDVQTVLPELPRTTMFGTDVKDHVKIEERQVLLEIWLQKVVNTVCFQCPDLFRFLSPSVGTMLMHINPRSSSSENEAKSDVILPPPPLNESGNPMSIVFVSTHVNVFEDSSWGTHFFDCEVIRWQIVQEPEMQTSFVVYTIIVKEFYSRTEFISWQIVKRYREFEALYKLFLKRFGDIPTPPLPPKKMNNNKPKVINERVRLLEAFLQQLINTAHFQIDELFTFLDLHNPQRQIITGVAFAGEFSDFLMNDNV